MGRLTTKGASSRSPTFVTFTHASVRKLRPQAASDAAGGGVPVGKVSRSAWQRSSKGDVGRAEGMVSIFVHEETRQLTGCAFSGAQLRPGQKASDKHLSYVWG